MVCHRHTMIAQWKIVTCSSLSLLVGFLLGVLLFWVNYVVDESIDNKWSYLARQFEGFITETGYFPLFTLALFLAIWFLSTVLMCNRRFTTISDYILVAIAYPVTGLTTLSPIVVSIIE